MSDISLPPEPPKPAKKHLFDRPVPKALLTLIGLLSPMPLMLALTNIWLGCCAPKEQQNTDPFSVIRQIFDGAGEPPFFLLPVALILPALLLIVLYRRSGLTLLAVLFVLLAVAGGEAFLFLQQTRG